MTQDFLFLFVVLIGLAYAIKNGKKAKRDIDQFNKDKKM
jgi:TRAP-type mannitol/chloroaromatic compound transport system permease small subunit